MFSIGNAFQDKRCNKLSNSKECRLTLKNADTLNSKYITLIKSYELQIITAVV